jgi:AAA domain
MTTRILPAFNGLSAPEVRPIPWLVPGFLARGAGTILFGQPGVSKTAHTAILCAALWRGVDFGAFVASESSLRVLYLDLDGGWDWTAPLFRAAFRGVGLEGLPETFFYYSNLTPECFEIDADTNEPKEPGLIGLEELGARIAATVKAYGIDLVITDSLGQFMLGDSNSGQDVSLALRLGLNPARAAGAAVLVIDHATKASRQPGQGIPTPAGSQQKRAWARCTVALEEEEHNGERATRWSVDKSNAEHFEPFLTKLHFQNSNAGQLETLTLELLGDAGERNKPADIGGELGARRKILERLAEGEARRKDFPKTGTFDRAIKDLLESGEIQKSDGVFSSCTIAPTPRGNNLVQVGIDTVSDGLNDCTNPKGMVQDLVQLLEDPREVSTNLHQSSTKVEKIALGSSAAIAPKSTTKQNAQEFIGASLTPELEIRFLNLKLLSQVDRTKLPNLVKAAKNGDTAALKQLYELEATIQARTPVKARA